MMELTQPVEWIKQACEGYVLQSVFSKENTVALKELMMSLENEFVDAVFCMPEESLHITLMDWIAPLISYDGQDKADLFEQIYQKHDTALTEILNQESIFAVEFNQIQVSPSTIYITGSDNGQFKRIRSKFMDSIDLLPGTKQPPQIIHSSLARFTKPLNIERVRAVLADKQPAISQEISSFRLVHTTREPMLEFEVLKDYPLLRRVQVP